MRKRKLIRRNIVSRLRALEIHNRILQEKVYDLVSMIDYIMQLLDEIGEEADSSVVDEISPPLA